MKPTCPKCGSHEIVTIEQLQGVCELIDISKGSDGSLLMDWRGSGPDWDGYTEVHWDSSETIGISCTICLYEEMTVDGFDYNDWTKKEVKE